MCPAQEFAARQARIAELVALKSWIVAEYGRSTVEADRRMLRGWLDEQNEQLRGLRA